MKRAPGIHANKPKALVEGSRIAVFSPSSPCEPLELQAGIAELSRLGFDVHLPLARESFGYFAGTHEERLQELCTSMHNKQVDGLIAARGGYGANYLIEERLATRLIGPKCVVGFSDLTTFQMLMWQVRKWVTFYGPMVAAGFNHGANDSRGYDEDSFLQAVRKTTGKWSVSLRGISMARGEAEGRLLGGCLTLLQAAIGTGWQLDTRGAILVLEDRAMKPYQVDRVLMHMKHAGMFERVRAIILGDFPDSDSLAGGGPTVLEVCDRILSPLDIPIVYGAPVGHTERPMLTLPLGIRARLHVSDEGVLEFLESAVVP